MKAATLLYHDVADDPESSGFAGGGPARYKMPVGEFARHLEALARARPEGPRLVEELLEAGAGALPFLLTFDDGGSSARLAADMLEGRGWRGHFLVTVQRIGTPAFLTSSDVRDLSRRGHRIGSHSYSHPDPMSACPPEVLREEWRRSVQGLEEILGHPVTAASVPGGAYSRKVAQAAAASGLRILFTSEPVLQDHVVDGCRVLGRFTIRSGVSPAAAAALARGAHGPSLRQYAAWNVRKAVKAIGGSYYLRLRRAILDRREDRRG